MIFLGLVSSTILSMIPHPITGRVELRKRLAKTMRDIGRLYGILVASYIVKPGQGPIPTETQMKQFRKLASDLQRQISDERNLLEHVVYEPPLRGKFPISEYKTITDQVDSMADLVHAMVKKNQIFLAYILYHATQKRYLFFQVTYYLWYREGQCFILIRNGNKPLRLH